LRYTPRSGPIKPLFTATLLAAVCSFYLPSAQAAPQGTINWISNAASGSRIQAADVQEIRNQIDAARVACGALAYNWASPPNPVSQGTAIRADTINEIIFALLQSPPFAANAAIPANVQPGDIIQASTITALKAALDVTICSGGGACPNGILDPGETCDDNNLANGDGCSSLCQCECAAWSNVACGPSGGCVPTDMHQNRNCPVPIAQCDQDQCLAGGCSGGPNCSDSIQNQDEIGIDCGGTICPPCACNFNGTCEPFLGEMGFNCADCLCGSNGTLCGAAAPLAPPCCSGQCGGTTCWGCLGAGVACAFAADCCTFVCSGGICAAATCSDGSINQDETGIDCGGIVCPSCGGGGGGPSFCHDAPSWVGGFCLENTLICPVGCDGGCQDHGTWACCGDDPSSPPGCTPWYQTCICT